MNNKINYKLNNYILVTQKLAFRLFNSLISVNIDEQSLSKDINILSGKNWITNKPVYDPTGKITVMVDNAVVDPELLNTTFYQEWETVKSKNIMDIFLDQYFHYLTTYGMGRSSRKEVYYPEERGAPPKVLIDNLVVINCITPNEFTHRMFDFIKNATSIETDILELIIEYLENTATEFVYKLLDEDIKSREISSFIYQRLNYVPRDPDEFLRYIVYILTGETLFIKNKEMLDSLEVKMNDLKNVELVLSLFREYEKHNNGIGILASNFNRNKDVYLRLKSSYGYNQISYPKSTKLLRNFINKISKLSKKGYHKKWVEPQINQLISNVGEQDEATILNILNKNTLMKVISLYNAILVNLNTTTKFIRIRNGKFWYYETNPEFNPQKYSDLLALSEIVKQNIVSRISINIQKHNIVLVNPNNILNLVLPQSGKLFMSNLPIGSYVNIPDNDKNIVIGVQWKNKNERRVDLDLSATNASGKVGWDADFCNNSAVYSGDVTDADPSGVELLMFIRTNDPIMYSINLNVFNNIRQVDYTLFVGTHNEVIKNHMLDPNNIVFQTGMNTGNNKQQTIGVYSGNKFWFDKIPSTSNVAGIEPKAYYSGLITYLECKLSLNEIINNPMIQNACQIVLNNKEERKHLILDLKNPAKDILLKLVE